MNSIPGREPRPDRSRYQSTQRNPQKGLLLGTDFRHAVEFSRNGRTPTRPLRASSMAEVLPYPASEQPPRREPPGWPPGPRGASRTIHDSGGPRTGGPPAARRGGSEPEEALDPDGEARLPGDLADGEQDSGHE